MVSNDCFFSAIMLILFRAILAFLRITDIFIAPYRPGNSEFGFLNATTLLGANNVFLA